MAEVLSAVEVFVSRRKNRTHYSVEVSRNNIVTHSSDPLKRGEKKEIHRLPPGFLQCSLCRFLTDDQERLFLHIKTAHEVIR
jgi:hypothetical protein